MQEVEAICDRVIIIDKGVIVADEEKSKIYSKIETALTRLFRLNSIKKPTESVTVRN